MEYYFFSGNSNHDLAYIAKLDHPLIVEMWNFFEKSNHDFEYPLIVEVWNTTLFL